jgi:peptidoglycan-associated lipoprotein
MSTLANPHAGSPRRRPLQLATLAAVAALLAACSSPVKLNDDVKVEDRTGKAVNAAGGGSQGSTGSQGQSGVTTVDLGANKAANASLDRVVYFDFDSFVVKDEFRGLVEGHGKRLNASKNVRMLVEGHTDERGGREYNLALGQKRAEAVVKALTLVGVDGQRLEAVSFGKERPVAEGHDEAAWAKNRRAELKDR